MKPAPSAFLLKMLWKHGEGCLLSAVVYFQTVKGDGDFVNLKVVDEIRKKQVDEIRLTKCLKMSDNFSKVDEIRADTKHPKNEPKRHQNSIPTSPTVNFCNRISIPNATLTIATLRHLPAVTEVQAQEGADGNGIARLWTKDLPRTLTELMALLYQQQISLLHLSVTRPTLEDVFVRLTGHELPSAEAS
jgi:hypothetical protein